MSESFSLFQCRTLPSFVCRLACWPTDSTSTGRHTINWLAYPRTANCRLARWPRTDLWRSTAGWLAGSLTKYCWLVGWFSDEVLLAGWLVLWRSTAGWLAGSLTKYCWLIGWLSDDVYCIRPADCLPHQTNYDRKSTGLLMRGYGRLWQTAGGWPDFTRAAPHVGWFHNEEVQLAGWLSCAPRRLLKRYTLCCQAGWFHGQAT